MADREIERQEECERIAQRIGQSVKYRVLCPATISDVVRKEAERSQAMDGLEERARERLHRVAAFYLNKTNLKKFSRRLRDGQVDRAEQARLLCETLLAGHSSTAERLPHLADIYGRLWEIAGRPKRILDLACAFHPFGLRWMQLDLQEIEYHAYDNNREIVECLNAYFELEGFHARAHWDDVIVNPPLEEADAALFLKMYHCAENREPHSALGLMERIRSRTLVISLPIRSLGSRGRAVGQAYPAAIAEFASRRGFMLRELMTPDEHFWVLLRETSTPRC